MFGGFPGMEGMGGMGGMGGRRRKVDNNKYYEILVSSQIPCSQTPSLLSLIH